MICSHVKHFHTTSTSYVMHARNVVQLSLNAQNSLSITWHQVYDRKTKRLVEELIDKKIVLSMRAIYQSKVGLGLINVGMGLFLFVILTRILGY